jgi:antitoxin ParD1/3/4
MTVTMNISLTDELRAFIDQNCGDGTLYATPSEYVRSLLRQEKEAQTAHEWRAGIVDGMNDLIHGRTYPFRGSMKDIIDQAQKDTNQD